jgi:two-component system chemotaxis sensor kinase CheA
VKDLADTSSQVDLITTELQMAVMKTRMVQIAKVFNKLPAAWCGTSRANWGRRSNWRCSAKRPNWTRSIIEEINDPLVHILRNAADHGVEIAGGTCAKKGKNRQREDHS